MTGCYDTEPKCVECHHVYDASHEFKGNAYCPDHCPRCVVFAVVDAWFTVPADVRGPVARVKAALLDEIESGALDDLVAEVRESDGGVTYGAPMNEEAQA